MKNKPSMESQIELLESRIAPAAVTIVSAHKATFVDPAGHLATVSVSTGSLASGDFVTVPS